jgi:hypothetical protein
MGRVRSGQRSGSVQFLLGAGVGLAFMLLTALGVLYGLGYWPAPDGPVADAQVDRDVPEPRPTAAWRFRSEWLTPRPK